MSDPFKTYRTASGRTIEASLRQYGEQKVAAALGKQLYREGVGIEMASVGLVPVDTGALRGSHYTSPPVRDGDVIRVEIGYGGPAAKINPKTGESTDGYALKVHEDLEAFHKVGSAKYLEMPFNQARAGMSARVAANMKNELAGGNPSPGSQSE